MNRVAKRVDVYSVLDETQDKPSFAEWRMPPPCMGKYTGIIINAYRIRTSANLRRRWLRGNEARYFHGSDQAPWEQLWPKGSAKAPSIVLVIKPSFPYLTRPESHVIIIRSSLETRCLQYVRALRTKFDGFLTDLCPPQRRAVHLSDHWIGRVVVNLTLGKTLVV